MFSTLIYDLEIIKCLPPAIGEERSPDLQYCEGWSDFENMGISTAAYGWLDGGDPIAFEWQDTTARSKFIESLNQADIVSGFNSINFDDNLLKANGVEVLTGYDILFECRLAAYGSINFTTSQKAIPTPSIPSRKRMA